MESITTKLDVPSIPFNRFIGIHRPPEDSAHILELNESHNYLNHLDTVHASAQFALAEATSGEFLLKKFSDYNEVILPVVRRVEMKYKKPARGKLFSRAEFSEKKKEDVIMELNTKKRSILTVNVEIYDIENCITLNSSFEWFIQRV